jgi:hypothetical protein
MQAILCIFVQVATAEDGLQKKLGECAPSFFMTERERS